MVEYNRRSSDSFPFRLLLSTIVLCTFLILGVLAFVIVNMNTRIDDSIESIEQGTICILGSVIGVEDIERPEVDEIESACKIFIAEVDNGRN